MLPEYRIHEADNAAYIATRRYKASDPMLCDDWHSEVLEALFTKCDDSFTLPQLLKYAQTCARHLLTREMRTIDRINQVLESAEIDDPDNAVSDLDFMTASGAADNPEDILITRETIAEIEQGIESLSIPQKICITLAAAGYTRGEAKSFSDIENVGRYSARMSLARKNLMHITAVNEYQIHRNYARGYCGRHPIKYSYEYPATTTDAREADKLKDTEKRRQYLNANPEAREARNAKKRVNHAAPNNF